MILHLACKSAWDLKHNKGLSLPYYTIAKNQVL